MANYMFDLKYDGLLFTPDRISQYSEINNNSGDDEIDIMFENKKGDFDFNSNTI